jgi:hypothetical protein
MTGRLNKLLIRGFSQLKGTVSRDFLLQVFFMNNLSPVPENNIRVISNILGDILISRCTTGINDTVGKVAIGTSDIVDTCVECSPVK